MLAVAGGEPASGGRRIPTHARECLAYKFQLFCRQPKAEVVEKPGLDVTDSLSQFLCARRRRSHRELLPWNERQGADRKFLRAGERRGEVVCP